MSLRASADRPRGLWRSRSADGGRCAFTLLEVIIATMIIGMLAMTLFRFVSSTLSAIRISTEISEERDALQAVLRLVQAQLNDLPPRGNAVLTGRANKFRNLANDEMTWACTAGPGLMTAGAPGEYEVTLTVQPVDERSTETELGLRRRTKVADASAGLPLDAIFSRGARGNSYNWLSLIRPMSALEIRYFDPNAGVWLEAWTNAQLRPRLVRLRMWRNADDPPVEAILDVPSANVQP